MQVTTPDLHWHSSHPESHRSPSSRLNEPLMEQDFLQSQLSKCSIFLIEFSNCKRKREMGTRSLKAFLGDASIAPKLCQKPKRFIRVIAFHMICWVLMQSKQKLFMECLRFYVNCKLFSSNPYNVVSSKFSSSTNGIHLKVL